MHQLEEETRALCEKGEFDAALRLCDGELSRAPHLPFLILLRKNIVDRLRAEVLEMNRQISHKLSGDHNLQHRLSILEAAAIRFPDEPYLNAKIAEVRQEEIQNRLSMARSVAFEGRFEEARAFLDTVKSLDPRNQDLAAELQRISQLQVKAKLALKKSRIMADIHAAFNQRSFERCLGLIGQALLEFADDSELKALEQRCIQLKDASIHAMQLFDEARNQIWFGEYELGIEKLRVAGQLDPDNRDIQTLHFDALIQFAKNIGEEEPKRARYLLELATRISPYNLALENASKYLSDKNRDRVVRDCTARVRALQQDGELEKALQLVEEIAEHHKLRSDPALQELRVALLEELGFAETVTESNSSHPPSDGPQPPPPGQTGEPSQPQKPSVRSGTNLISRFQSAKVTEHLRRMRDGASKALTSRSQPPDPEPAPPANQREASGWFVPDLISRFPWGKVVENSAETVEHLRSMKDDVSKVLSSSMSAVGQWLNFLKTSFLQLPLKVKIGISTGLLISLFASAIIGMTNEPKPAPAVIGTGTMLMPATLLEQPANSSRSAGRLKTGQPVEILSSLPARSLDSWVLIHPVGGTDFGYVRLQQLDRISTNSDEFNLWHAMTFLNRSSNPGDLKNRVAIVDNALKAEPLMPSRETDRIFLTISKAFARIAQDNLSQPDVAKLAIENADAYLSHITGALIFTDEAEELKASMNALRTALGESEEDAELVQTLR